MSGDMSALPRPFGDREHRRATESRRFDHLLDTYLKRLVFANTNSSSLNSFCCPILYAVADGRPSSVTIATTLQNAGGIRASLYSRSSSPRVAADISRGLQT